MVRNGSGGGHEGWDGILQQPWRTIKGAGSESYVLLKTRETKKIFLKFSRSKKVAMRS